MTIYALNLFDIANQDEYLAYSRRSVDEVETHGGHVVALGKFQENAAGDISPRTVLILVEWESKEAHAASMQVPEVMNLVKQAFPYMDGKPEMLFEGENIT